MNVNDGKGLYDTAGMFDSLIVDCDNLLKLLFDGQRVAFCADLLQMIQKISALKKGVLEEMNELRKNNEDGDANVQV